MGTRAGSGALNVQAAQDAVRRLRSELNQRVLALLPIVISLAVAMGAVVRPAVGQSGARGILGLVAAWVATLALGATALFLLLSLLYCTVRIGECEPEPKSFLDLDIKDAERQARRLRAAVVASIPAALAVAGLALLSLP